MPNLSRIVVSILVFVSLLIPSVFADATYARIINSMRPGQEMEIADFAERGKVTIFCFYAKWDSNCTNLLPYLEKLDMNRPDIVVYLLDIEPPQELKLKNQFPLQDQYGVGQVPFFVIFDQNRQLASEGKEAFELVNKLIQATGKPAQAQNKPQQSLIEALAMEKEEPSLALLAKNVNINEKDKKGWTPLHWAVFTGKNKATAMLIGKSADVNIKTPKNETPLHLACFKGNLEAARLLINNKADVNAKTAEGATPLHWAVHYNARLVLELLVQRGAKVDEQDKRGFSALDLAMNEGKADMVNFLARYSKAELPNKKKTK